MQLCIDIGNTRTKWGVFRERELLADGVFDAFSPSDLVALYKQYPIDRTMYMSVKAVPFEIEEVISLYSPVQRLTHKTPVPFNNLYGTPETLGSDRVALVAGGISVFPGNEVLVVSAGTCITFDLAERSTDYHGGSIHPGIRMRLQAMHAFTGKLPLTTPELQGNIIGNSTVSSLQVGAVIGAAKEIDGMITAYRKQYPDLKVILTGGDSPLLVAMLENEIFAHPTLSLAGLNEIQLYNASEN